jgi:hypothetical protein
MAVSSKVTALIVMAGKNNFSTLLCIKLFPVKRNLVAKVLIVAFTMKIKWTKGSLKIFNTPKNYRILRLIAMLRLLS